MAVRHWGPSRHLFLRVAMSLCKWLFTGILLFSPADSSRIFSEKIIFFFMKVKKWFGRWEDFSRFSSVFIVGSFSPPHLGGYYNDYWEADLFSGFFRLHFLRTRRPLFAAASFEYSTCSLLDFSVFVFVFFGVVVGTWPKFGAKFKSSFSDEFEYSFWIFKFDYEI